MIKRFVRYLTVSILLRLHVTLPSHIDITASNIDVRTPPPAPLNWITADLHIACAPVAVEILSSRIDGHTDLGLHLYGPIVLHRSPVGTGLVVLSVHGEFRIALGLNLYIAATPHQYKAS